MTDADPAQPSLDVLIALRATGAVRTFADDPVDDGTLHAVLDTARFAPSGGNRQPWRVAIVRDVAIRRRLADLMRPVWADYVAAGRSDATPFAFGRGPDAATATCGDPSGDPSGDAPVPNALLDGIERIPVVLAVAADLRSIALMDGILDRPPITGGASLYPFCWSLLLAARAHGLGGVMTTFLSRAEPGAVDVLGLPDDHALAATIFLGVPEHRPTRLRRRPVETFASLDRFDGPPFHPEIGTDPHAPLGTVGT
jgi:nitroreductase